MLVRRHIIGASIGLLAGIGVTQAQAQDPSHFPERPLRVLVPNTAGSTSDYVARLFAEGLTQRLGQTVIIENKPGSGGLIAGQTAARANPDGYTLLFVNSQHAINPTAYSKLPYDTLRDFAGLALVGDTP